MHNTLHFTWTLDTHKRTSCAAQLHLPQGNPSTKYEEKPPVILMVHGWGGVQTGFLPDFYAHFIAAGFAVATFDYPSWGQSEGQPRNHINPWQRVRDIEAVLAHLKQCPQVDNQRVVLWGTSFGGGHVVELAARHPELLGAMAQVPMLDGRLAVRATPFALSLRLAWQNVQSWLPFTKPVYIPVIAPEGELASMTRDGAFVALQRVLGQDGVYDNRVTARSLTYMGFYRPITQLKNIRVPTLLIAGTRDSVAPFDAAVVKKMANPNIQVHLLDANHFEPYFDAAFAENIQIQLAFLQSLL